MGGRSALRLALLVALHACLFAALLRAQAPPVLLGRCRPALPRPGSKVGNPANIDPAIIFAGFDCSTGILLCHNILPDSDQAQITLWIKRTLDNSPGYLQVLDDKVRGLLTDQGYFKAEVTAMPMFTEGGGHLAFVSVRIHIDEGLQYRLKDIRIQSSNPDVPLVLPTDQLRALIPLKDGDIFSTKAIRDSLDALRLAYSSRGYIDVTAQPLTEIDDDSRQISLTLEIDQERQFRVGTVEIYGLSRKLEKTLRSQIKPGDVFNPGAINEFYARYKSALLPDASPKDVQTHRENHALSLVFDFRPCPPSEKRPQY
jgi:outer membrane protein insertion porin family